MDRFAIITNRKRAIIALVHSVFFLGVAGMQLAISHAEAFSIHREKMTGSMILLVYLCDRDDGTSGLVASLRIAPRKSFTSRCAPPVQLLGWCVSCLAIQHYTPTCSAYSFWRALF